MEWTTIFAIAGAVVGGAISYIFGPKETKEDPLQPASTDHFRGPQAEDGAQVPVIFGTVRIHGPNTIFMGSVIPNAIYKEEKHSIEDTTGWFWGPPKEYISGYTYDVEICLGLCTGPEVGLIQMWINDKTLWKGPSREIINFRRDYILGGPDKGGGVWGQGSFQTGVLFPKQNKGIDGQPNYNGLAYIYIRKMTIGEYPSMPKLSFECDRFPNQLKLTDSELKLDQDMNPMAILADVLMSQWGGLGLDDKQIDTQSLINCAETLADEKNFMSLIISRRTSANEVIKSILDQSAGLLYQNTQTGKITAKLLREDYKIVDLPVFDEKNIININSYIRGSWDTTANQVKVLWTDRRRNYKSSTAIAQDLANINTQNRVKSETIKFPGCSNPDLAAKIASRELSFISKPLVRLEVFVDKNAANLDPGDVFIFSWKKFGVKQIIMRVDSFDHGTLLDGRIKISATQDRFSTYISTYAPPLEPPVATHDRTPEDIKVARLWEVPLFFVNKKLEVNEGAFVTLAVKPGVWDTGYNISGDAYNIKFSAENQNYANSSETISVFGEYSGGSFGYELPGISIKRPVNLKPWMDTASQNEIRTGKNLFLINNEIMAFESAETSADGSLRLINIYRYLLNSESSNHPENSTIFLLDNLQFIPKLLEGPSTSVIDCKFASFSDSTNTNVEEGLDVTAKTQNKTLRPLQPGQVKINGIYPDRALHYKDSIDFDLTFATRNPQSKKLALYDDPSENLTDKSTTYNAKFYVNGIYHKQIKNINPISKVNVKPKSHGPHIIKIEISAKNSQGYESLYPTVITFPIIEY